MSEARQENRSGQIEEFRGKTVEAAVSAGLAALQLSRDQVEIEVVKAGSRGVLGIGAEDAIVRLSVLPGPEAAPAVKQAAVKVTRPKPKSEAPRPSAPAEDRQQVPPKTATPRGETAASGRGPRRAEGADHPVPEEDPGGVRGAGHLRDP